MTRRGLFISFEGSEACGKTTQIVRLRERIVAGGGEVVVTREPGGTVIGEKIRDLLQYTPEAEGMAPEAEVLLFAASRAQLVRERIGPELEAGRHVIADRFHDSTTVYQGFGRGLPMDAVEAVNGLAVDGCVPDVTFLLDLDDDAARVRLEERRGPEDRMEGQGGEFFERVRQGYSRLAMAEPGRIVVLDGAVAPEELGRLIWRELKNRFHGVFD